MSNWRRRNGGLLAWLRVHRVLGLTSALFVLILSLTGIALNHTEALRLDERRVSAGWLLDWYGLAPPGEPAAFAHGGVRVAGLADVLALDGRVIEPAAGPPTGVAAAPRFVAIAAGGDLLLITPAGELVERLGPVALPGKVTGLGLAPGGRLAVRTDAEGAFQADVAVTDWRPLAEPGAVDWSRPVPATPEERAALERAWRGAGLSSERVLLDLHSGRILGGIGVWLMDAMAAIFMILAVTGIWVWWRRRGNGPRRPN